MEVASVMSYRNKHEEPSSDSDSDDSQKDLNWKRPKAVPSRRNHIAETKSQDVVSMVAGVSEADDTKTQCSDVSPLPVSRKRKLNNIWCTVLEDQTMSETLKDCGLRNKPKNAMQRSVESYDHTLKYTDPRNKEIREEHMFSDERLSDTSESTQTRHAKRFKTSSNKFVKLEESGVITAKKIIKILNEQKHYLIYRVVKVIGEEKALLLLNMTEDIEENGGMMINNNSRRRTPGGVYFQLLKGDKSITKEQIDEIFEGEYSSFDLRKVYQEQKKRKKQFKSQSKKDQDVESMDLQPVSPTYAGMDLKPLYVPVSPIYVSHSSTPTYDGIDAQASPSTVDVLLKPTEDKVSSLSETSINDVGELEDGEIGD